MKKFIIPFFIFIVFWSNHGKAQINPDLNDSNQLIKQNAIISIESLSAGINEMTNIQSVSPNTFSFAKYLDNPVSLYTGVPLISIPIGSISEDGASLDISLTYHGSGIKVDELASWVGLGWSLNVGGLITRIVHGQPEYPNANGDILPVRVNLGFPDPQGTGGSFTNLSIFEEAVANNRDIEPDEFYYNFNGKSGRFIFDNNGDASFFKYEDIKIEFVKSNSSGLDSETNSKFIITTAEGIKYEFDRIETLSINQKYFPTAWYLTKVESPTGGILTLNYNTQSGNHYVNYKTSRLIGYTNFGGGLVKNIPDIDYWTPIPTSSLESVLSSVTSTKSGKIVFNLNNVNTTYTRKDYPMYSTVFPLGEIVFYSTDNITALKRVKFHTSYFQSGSFIPDQFIGASDYSPYEHLRFRLKLDSLSFWSGSNALEQPSYKFKYYTDLNNSVYNLPFRLSPSQDHWGYFNNANNRTLIPSVTWNTTAGYWLNKIMNLTGNDDLYTTNAFNGGANKEPNSEAVKACALQKIFYPTGGYTVYDFEINQYTDGYGVKQSAGGLRIASIKSYDKDNTLLKEKKYKYESFDQSISPPFSGTSSGHLVDDPRKYYVLIGKARENNGFFEKPESELSSIFGDDYDWNFALNSLGYVFKVSAIPQTALGSTHGQSVGYSCVIEYEEGNGYRVNYFSTPSDFPNFTSKLEVFGNVPADIFRTQYSTTISTGGWFPYTYLIRYDDIESNQFPFLNPYDNEWQRGNLLETRIYNQSKKMLFKETNEYFLTNQNNIAAYKVHMMQANQSAIHGKYYVPVNWVSIKKQTISQYDQTGSNPVTSIVDFGYNSVQHKFLTSKKSYNSINNLIETKYFYPSDYSGQFTTLINKNIISQPIDVRTYNGTRLISGEQTKYNDYGQPIDLYNFESSATDVAFSTTNPFTFTHKQTVAYDATYKKPTKVNLDNDVYTHYIWGYNKAYPVAKIVTPLSTTISVTVNDNSLSKSDVLTSIKNDVTYLKGLLTTYLNNVNYQVTIYTYKPHFGITSQTDPTGITTFYQYDSFGRLEYVKDNDEKLLKKNVYHYSGM